MAPKQSNSLMVKTYTFIKSFFVVAGWTGMSRVSGLVREIIFANIFGASCFSDIYTFAIKLPNFFRRFFAEGALNAVLVPKFSDLLTYETKENIQRFAQQMFAVLASGLFVFVIVFEIIMPLVVQTIAPGMRHNFMIYSQIVYFARWMFPYIWLISIVALMSGFLNSMHHFAWPAAISIIVNLAMITALIIGKLLKQRISLHGILLLLSLSILVGGVIQCIILWKECAKNGLMIRWRKPKLTPEIRQVLKASIPGMIGASVMQINIFVDMAFASSLPVGSVSYLSYADRLNQLPLSLFGAAMGTTLLPALSRNWSQHNTAEAYKTQNKAILFGLFLVMPAAVGLFVLAQPIVDLLYGHGRFDQYAIMQTMLALKAFVFGLPAYILTKVFSTIFFANKDTKTPVVIAAICVITNGILNYILKGYFAHVGIAMATAISSTLNATLCIGVLVHRRLLCLELRHIGCVVKIIGIALIMGGGVAWIAQKTQAWNKISVLIPIVGGLAVYALLIWLAKIRQAIEK